MTGIYDNDILITKTDGNIYLDLKCGYGQPCVTTVYLKQSGGGETKKICGFDNNIDGIVVGSVKDLKYHSIEIHTTVDDIHDSQDEVKDISLSIKVYDEPSNSVDFQFQKKTQGKGTKFHSFYTVTII